MSPARCRRLARLALAALPLAACASVTVVPRATPARVAAVEPPIARRALLLLAPAFTGSTLRSVDDTPPVTLTTNYRVGVAAESLVTDWARRSFAEVEVRHLSDADALRAFTLPGATDAPDVVLLPRLDATGAPYDDRLRFGVALRLDVRSTRTGAVRTWASAGRARNRAFGAGGHGAARALEQALAALGDSVRTARDSL